MKIVDKKQFCSGIITIVATLVLLWFALSYGEVLCKNTTPNPQYSSINLFAIMEGIVR